MSRKQKRRDVLKAAGTVVLVGGLAGCGGDGGDGEDGNASDGGTGTDGGTATMAGNAVVRLAHLSPDAGEVDVYFDDTAVAEGATFGDFAATETSAGTRTVEVRPAGGDEAVFSTDVELAADTRYTVAVIGEAGGEDYEPSQELTAAVLEDDTSPVDGDSARLRLLHAVPDAGAVDVTLEGQDGALFDEVPFGESGTVTAEANDYTLQVREASQTNTGRILGDFDESLNGGTAYTAFAAGYVSSDPPVDQSFGLIVVQDQTGDGMSGTATETSG